MRSMGPVTDLVKRPMASGHLGELLASKVFGIELEESAVAAGNADRRAARHQGVQLAGILLVLAGCAAPFSSGLWNRQVQ